jgi:hypothetical protein
VKTNYHLITIKNLILLFFANITIFILSFHLVDAYTPISGSPMAEGTHPRLLITQDTIPGLRNTIARYHSDKYQKYVNWAASEDPNDKHNVLDETGHDLVRALMVNQAFIYTLGNVPGISYPVSPDQFARRAIDSLKKRLKAGDELAYVAALTYDWTYNAMTNAERSEIGHALKNRRVKHKVFDHSVERPDINPEQMFSSKYYEGFYAWYLGLALWGDGIADASADRAVDTFFDVMLNYGYLDAQNFAAGEAGGWPEWIGYSNWHPRSHLLLIAGWSTATGEDYIRNGTTTGNAIRAYPEFVHYAVDPHKYFGTTYTYVRMGGAQTTDTVITGNRSLQSQTFFLPRYLAESGLSQEAGLMRHFIDTYDRGWIHYDHYNLWGFLGVPHSVSPVTPGQIGFPKARWMRNLGAFIARTGFDSPADGVFYVSDGHFRFAGNRGVQAHPGFGLVKFGELVNTRNVAHRGYGNLDDYPDAHPKNVVYFERDHYRSHTSIDNPFDLEQALKGQGDHDHGGIEQVTIRNGDFYHVQVNRSRQFQDGVRHTREYVWLPGENPAADADFLVVYDRTVSPSKPHWVYHVPWKPQVTNHASTEDLTTGSGTSDRIGTAYLGTNLIVKELNSIGGEKDNEGGTANNTGGAGAHGVAFSRTLLPQQVRVEVTRVAQFDKAVIKRQHDLAIKSHRWQVDVIPIQSSNEQRFLHVFETGDANLKSSMVATSLLEAGNHMQGVWIEREAANRPNYVVLFNNNEGVNSNIIMYTVNGHGHVKHIVTGLKPFTNYRLEELSPHGATTKIQATENGTSLWDYKGVDTTIETGSLYFASSIAGTHTYKLTPIGGGPLLPPEPIDKKETTPPAVPSGFRVVK